MKIFEPGSFVAYTPAQLISATSTFSAALARVRNETLDDDMSDRLGHGILLLGTRAIMEKSGYQLDPMTVTRYQDLIIKEFGVKSQSVDNDLKKFKTEDIITITRGQTDDGREALIGLTEVGEILYKMLGTHIANLILTMAELLKEDGAVPADPRSESKEFLKDYAVPVRRESGRSTDTE